MGTHSDFYVRVPVSELSAVQIRQLLSRRDVSIAVPASTSAAAAITGITEWVGTWQNEAISVGWDWAVINGVVVLLSPNEIRTNIQLISPDHRPVPRMMAQIYLYHWIESIPWREIAVNDLLGCK